MTRAEEAALLAYDTNTPAAIRIAYRDGYEQAEKDTIERAVSWIKKNTCMGVYEQELMRKELEDEK